jgi:hypothetical protein
MRNNKMNKKSMTLVNIINQHVKSKNITIAEIGVYKGENAEFMLKQLVKAKYNVTYYGLDLFEDAVSYNLKETNPGVYDETVAAGKIQSMAAHTVYAKLIKIMRKVTLIKGDTKKTIPQFADRLKNCDFFYIDGGHDYNSVKSDWNNVNKIAKIGSIIVFDDVHATGIKRLTQEIEKTGIKMHGAFGSRKYLIKGKHQ